MVGYEKDTYQQNNQDDNFGYAGKRDAVSNSVDRHRKRSSDDQPRNMHEGFNDPFLSSPSAVRKKNDSNDAVNSLQNDSKMNAKPIEEKEDLKPLKIDQEKKPSLGDEPKDLGQEKKDKINPPKESVPEGITDKDKKDEKEPKRDKKKGEELKKEDPKEDSTVMFPDNFFTPENLFKTVTKINWLDFFIKISKIILIIVCFNFVNRFAKTALNKHIKKLLNLHKAQHHADAYHKDKHRFQLAETIFPIIESVITWALGFLTLLMMAQQLGLDTAPIYGSVLALGFGFSFASQNTIKDIINGLFTLFDGNISVGDYVKIGDKEGYVESMSLRAIVLRYQSGSLQLIPFSQASSIMNCTREFTCAELIVTVGHDANFDDVVESYHAVYYSLKDDNFFGKWIKSELSPVVIQKIDHWGINAKSQIKITPDPENDFSMEFYKRLLSEFRKRDIPLAFSKKTRELRKKEDNQNVERVSDDSQGNESVNLDGSEESED